MKRKPTFEELKYVQDEVSKKGKNVILAYILTLFFGYLGVHLGYLRKKKLAFVRILLTFTTIGSVYLIGSTVDALATSELTMRLQQYSSVITVVFGLSIAIHGLWFLFDLISIPGEVDKINSEIEKDATDSITHSTYAAESIMSDEVYQKVMGESLKLAMEKVDAEVDERLVEAREEITKIGNIVQSRNRDIEKIIENIDSNIETVNKLNESLSEDLDSIQKTALKDLRSVKSAVRDHLNNESIEGDEYNQKSIRNDEYKAIEKEKKEPIETDRVDYIGENKEDSVEIDHFGPVKNNNQELTKVDNHKSAEDDKQENTEEDKKAKSVNDNNSNVKIKSKIDGECDIEHTPTEDNKDFKKEGSVNEVSLDEDIEKQLDEDDNLETNEDEVLIENESVNDTSNELPLEEQKEASEDESKDKALNVIEAIEVNKKRVSIEGYIVGAMNENRELIKKGIKSNSNIVIADNADEDDINKSLIVQLTKSGGLRDNFGGKKNPEIIGKSVTVTGFRDRYFNRNGIKKINDIKFKDE